MTQRRLTMRRRRRSHCCHYCCCCCSSCCCHCSRRSRSHCFPLRTRPSCPWPWTELGAGCRRLGRRPTSVKWWCGVICECQGSAEVEGEEAKEGEGEHHLLPQGEQKRQSGLQNYASLQSIILHAWTSIGGSLACLVFPFASKHHHHHFRTFALLELRFSCFCGPSQTTRTCRSL